VIFITTHGGLIMKIKDQMDTLKDVLSAEQLSTLEESIKKIVN
jgi:hypothetical protein